MFLFRRFVIVSENDIFSRTSSPPPPPSVHPRERSVGADIQVRLLERFVKNLAVTLNENQELQVCEICPEKSIQGVQVQASA